MVAQNIFFGIMATVMIGSALKVVTTRNVVHAALWLILVLAGAAGQFLLLGAEFVGVTQILVYIGAVIVLFLFGIMLTKASMGDDEDVSFANGPIAAGIALLLLGIMAYATIDFWRDTELPENAQPQTAEQVSDSIFSDFIVPFEATSVLLLAALIGAIVVARRE
jgi:NADH-quinone oxidoreductase subunit J